MKSPKTAAYSIALAGKYSLESMDYNEKGKCNKTYIGAEIGDTCSCVNWERRYD